MTKLPLALLCASLILTGCEETNYYATPTPPTPAPATPKPIHGPVLLSYDFETVVGAFIPDLSGNDYDMLVTGCSLVPGPVGQALSCGDHGSASIVVGERDVIRHLYGKTAMTAQFWLNYSYVSGENGYILGMSGTYFDIEAGQLHFRPTYWVDTVLDTPLASNTWYNLAVTFDGSTTKFYVNGIPVQSAGIISPLGNGTTDHTIELFPGYYEGKMSGQIDNLRIHDVVLSDEEILAAYNADI